MNAPYFPGDLRAQAVAEGARIQVAGRVLNVAEQRLLLADALTQVVVQLTSAVTCREGAWVICQGEWRGGALLQAELEWQAQAPPPRGDGEVQRFVFAGVGPRLAARARALQCVREYFSAEGFLEVETPYRVVAPGVDPNVDAFAAADGYLITSPELEMKRLLVGGVLRQFQFARVSRRDEAGSLHEAEFTLLEWYRAFAGLRGVQQDTERLVQAVALALSGSPRLVLSNGRTIDVEPPFEHVRVADAFREHAGIQDVADLAASDEARYFELLVERVEPALARCDRALFLEAYPISQAALAQPESNDPRFAERFELYAGGVELCNGYGELTDATEQRRRFEHEHAERRRSGRSVYPMPGKFLSALAEGMPPAGGNALGFDRLVMLALGAHDIQEVIAFPRSTL